MVRSPNAKCVNEQIDVHLKNSHKNVSRMITARKTAEISSNKLLNRCVAYDTAWNANTEGLSEQRIGMRLRHAHKAVSEIVNSLNTTRLSIMQSKGSCRSYIMVRKIEVVVVNELRDNRLQEIQKEVRGMMTASDTT